MSGPFLVFWRDKDDVIRSNESVPTLAAARRIAVRMSLRFAKATVRKLTGPHFHEVVEVWMDGKREEK